jgi:hypothetical protein
MLSGWLIESLRARMSKSPEERGLFCNLLWKDLARRR